MNRYYAVIDFFLRRILHYHEARLACWDTGLLQPYCMAITALDDSAPEKGDDHKCKGGIVYDEQRETNTEGESTWVSGLLYGQKQ
jgi:hypothetical protein